MLLHRLGIRVVVSLGFVRVTAAARVLPRRSCCPCWRKCIETYRDTFFSRRRRGTPRHAAAVTARVNFKTVDSWGSQMHTLSGCLLRRPAVVSGVVPCGCPPDTIERKNDVQCCGIVLVADAPG